MTLKLMDPYGFQKTYVYLTNSELTRTSLGLYTCVIIPDKPGRWHYRWIGGTTVAEEANFNVRTSPFWDNMVWPDYR